MNLLSCHPTLLLQPVPNNSNYLMTSVSKAAFICLLTCSLTDSKTSRNSDVTFHTVYYNMGTYACMHVPVLWSNPRPNPRYKDTHSEQTGDRSWPRLSAKGGPKSTSTRLDDREGFCAMHRVPFCLKMSRNGVW